MFSRRQIAIGVSQSNLGLYHDDFGNLAQGSWPIFGQFGFFHKFAGSEIEDKRPYERYQNETKRLLGVINGQLEKTEYIAGDEYTIADIALWPWMRTLGGFYDAADEIELDSFKAVGPWLEKCSERPASQKAVNIPSRD